MEEHLPVLGVGPLYVAAILIATVAVLIMDWLGVIPSYSPLPYALTSVIALVLIALGVFMWYSAVIKSRIGKDIEDNRLVTDGIYAWVRNPIYSAFMFIAWGLLVWSGNLYLLVLAPVFWFLMTAMMAATEEKWLADLYGREYTEYCGRVNRCIPWFPRKKA